jgi:hypothetical protein
MDLTKLERVTSDELQALQALRFVDTCMRAMLLDVIQQAAQREATVRAELQSKLPSNVVALPAGR